MIYLDNAATSFPKPEKVYQEICNCMRIYCANPGRGGHRMAIRSSRVIHDTRTAICKLFNIDNPMRVVLTKNTTEALNIAIKGILRHDGHAIISCMEHNSVIRPLKELEKTMGIKISVVNGNDLGQIDPNDFIKHIRKDTQLIISTLSSNVNGMVMPVKEIGQIARDNNIPYLVDGAQGTGTLHIDVEAMNIDLLAFPGHKGLMGPQGTGGLYIRPGIDIRPLMQGGTGSNSENMFQPEIMPDLLESGTLNTPGFAGLRAGIDFISVFGTDNIGGYKNELISTLVDGLKMTPNVTVYSSADSSLNSGIAAFNIKGLDSNEVSYLLDNQYEIAARGGLHCAPLAHGTLGTLQSGIVRFSVSCFNTIHEIRSAVEAVAKIAGEKGVR